MFVKLLDIPYCFILSSLESLDSKEIKPVNPKGNQPEYSLEGLCWSSNILATWCKELTHWKRPCCWEGLGAGGEGDDRGWDGWIVSPTRWIWVWIDSENWWWTVRPGVLWFMGSQRVGHDWATELNWLLELKFHRIISFTIYFHSN